MIKNSELLEKRKEYIKNYVSGFRNKSKAINDLREKLFISKATIYNDLK